MAKKTQKERYKRDGRGRFATANLPKGIDPESTEGKFELAKREKTRNRIKLHRLKNKQGVPKSEIDKAEASLNKAKQKLSEIQSKAKAKEGGESETGPQADPTAILLDKLKNNNYTKLEEGMGGVTASFLVEVEDDGRAIVKPQMTREIARQIHGDDTFMMNLAMTASDSVNEVAAYDISRRLGFNAIPETTLRDDGSSIQAWVEDGTVSGDANEKAKGEASRRSLGRIAILDAIIGNEDRHENNSLLGDDGEFIAIDHGGAFEAFANGLNTGYPSKKVDVGTWVDEINERRYDRMEVEFHPDDIQAVKKLWNDDKFFEEFEAQFGNKRKEVVRRGLEGVINVFGIDPW